MIYNADHILALEDQNPLPGGVGETYWVSLATAPADQPRGVTTPVGRSALDMGGRRVTLLPAAEQRSIAAVRARGRIQKSYQRVIADSMRRVIKRERQDVLAGVQKHLKQRAAGDLLEFIDTWYRGHTQFVADTVEPAFRALAEALGPEIMGELEREFFWNDRVEEFLVNYLQAFARRHANFSAAQLRQAVTEALDEGADVSTYLETRFDEWETGLAGGLTRAEKIGAEQSISFGQRLVRSIGVAAGVVAIVWRANGDACDACLALDGMRVGIEAEFVGDGEELSQGEGKDPIKPSAPVYEPPVHPGCNCGLGFG